MRLVGISLLVHGDHMDGCYLKMLLFKSTGGFIVHYKKSCLQHVAAALGYKTPKACPTGVADAVADQDTAAASMATAETGDKEEGDRQGGDRVDENERFKRIVKPVLALRTVVHLAVSQDQVPTRDEIAYYLAFVLFGGAIHPRRFVVTSVKVVKPGPWSNGKQSNARSEEETLHPDLATPSEKGGADAPNVLTMRKLASPKWSTMQRKLDQCKTILEVSLLVCGSCKSLRERRWLCQVLEDERSEMQQE